MLLSVRLSNLNKLSTEYARKSLPLITRFQTQEQPDRNKTLTVDNRVGSVQQRSKVKKPIEPFVKNLFLGKFDRYLLTYPELDQESLENITEFGARIEKYLSNEVKSQDIDERGVVSCCLDKLKELEIFNVNIPNSFGGKEWNETQRVFLNESTAFDLSVSHFVSNIQELGTNVIKTFGTPLQKEKYLKKIMTGDCLPAFCFFEECPTADPRFPITTLATSSDTEECYFITGTKNLISSAIHADLFIVIASTLKIEHEKRIPCLTVFLVDKKSPGIKIDPPIETIGVKGLHISNVKFDNVQVPCDNILGELHSGLNVINKINGMGRLSVGAQCSSVLKKITHETIQHCVHRNHLGLPYSELNYIQAFLADLAMRAYSVESVTYLLSGTVDTYDNPDVMLETTILKILASQETNYVINKSFELIGPAAYSVEHPLTRLSNDAKYFLISDDVIYNNKLMMCYLGLQHASEKLQEEIKKIRNPFIFPKDALKRAFAFSTNVIEKPKLKQELKQYLHPTLQASANLLEHCVEMLEYSIKYVFMRHGSEIIDKHLEVLRIADMVIDIYTLTAVLGRASRSYCIGLRNANIEMQIAITLTRIIHNRVKLNAIEVEAGPVANNDNHMVSIGKELIKNGGGYILEHPLQLNY